MSKIYLTDTRWQYIKKVLLFDARERKYDLQKMDCRKNFFLV